jgi:hypothetical protein
VAFGFLESKVIKITALGLASWASASAYTETVRFLKDDRRGHYRLEDAEGQFARNNIVRGYGVLQRVMDGTYVPRGTEADHSRDMAALMWALYDSSVHAGKPYEQGSFVVEDRDGRLFGFLSRCPGASLRISSHLKSATRITGAGHYGIDMLGSYRPGDSGWEPSLYGYEQKVLPARKGTVLFIPLFKDEAIGLDRQYVFIKMEDHGLQTWSGWAMHGWDFVAGTVLGMKGPSKDFTRKERVDPALAASYEKILRHLPPELKGASALQAKGLGVRAMLAQAKAMEGKVQGPAMEAIEEFRGKVKAKGYDHEAVRTGDEIIFSHEELREAVTAHWARVGSERYFEMLNGVPEGNESLEAVFREVNEAQAPLQEGNDGWQMVAKDDMEVLPGDPEGEGDGFEEAQAEKPAPDSRKGWAGSLWGLLSWAP